MRLVLSDFISLDGVVQAPGGAEEDTEGGFSHGGWSMPYFDDEVMGGAIDGGMASTDAFLFGRRTWQVMASAWPERVGDPFADRINQIDKYVVSRTMGPDDVARWNNSTLLPSKDVAAEVAGLKAQEGGNIQVLGSSQLARFLVSNDLVDEYLLMIEPIVLGGGKSIFPTDGQAHPLELHTVTQTSTGVIIAAYTRA